MESRSQKVYELTTIADIIKNNKCEHYNYDQVLEQIRRTAAMQDISRSDDIALHILLERVFYVKRGVAIECSGCHFAAVIRGILMEKLSGITSFLYKALDPNAFNP